MRPNAVRERLDRDEGPAVLGWLSGDSPYLAETLSHAGFDAVTVDLQHGMFGLDAAVRLIQAVSAGPAQPWARSPNQDPAVIGKLLDAGAYGIICPGIDSVAQAEAFVRACRYPPSGNRSFGPARALLYGGADYVEHADDVVLTWAMIESRPGLEAVEEIAAVPGLSGLYVGPNDLSLALGLRPARTPAPPELDAAWRRVLEAARAAGIYAATFCADGPTAHRLSVLGYDVVTPGNDAAQLRAGATAAVAAARGEVPAGPGSAPGY